MSMIDVESFYALLRFDAPPKPPHGFELENIGALLLEEEGEGAVVRFIHDAPGGGTVSDESALHLLQAELDAPCFFSTSRAGRLCAHFPCSGSAEEFAAILSCMNRIITFLQTGEIPEAEAIR